MIALSGCQAPAPVTSGPTQDRYVNARVFDGTSFVRRDICVEGREIVPCDTANSNDIDLAGAFIIPPFGDAHTHHFDGEHTLDWHTQIGLQSGAFYTMNLTAPSTQVELIRDRMRGVGRVDVISSTGGITGPDSHPAEIYEAIAIGAYTFEDQLARADEIRASRKVADDAYYVVENEADVHHKWPLILSRRPDLIKVFLRTSERYAEGFGKWGPGGGIDPNLLPLIRAKADDAGLRLAAAASRLGDFRAAVTAGADIVSHLPCYQDPGTDPDNPYFVVRSEGECLITAADAGQAASAGTAVVLITTEWPKDRTAQVVDWERRNTRVLKSAGVPLAIGSNAYGSTILDGMVAGVEKGFLTPLDMLRVATGTTPRLIFPDRRIGCLDAGCEASFIALAADPLFDFAAVRKMRYLVKDGEPIVLDAGDT